VADDGQSRADAGALSAGYERLRSAVLSGGGLMVGDAGQELVLGAV
jgi:hypothetical protein